MSTGHWEKKGFILNITSASGQKGSKKQNSKAKAAKQKQQNKSSKTKQQNKSSKTKSQNKDAYNKKIEAK
ncbi:MAG TPA: hypothetical protein PLN48_04325 [Lachnospiraceae bacterium]|nr:hypothetical protein [Lachnospiraceae bacterium]